MNLVFLSGNPLLFHNNRVATLIGDNMVDSLFFMADVFLYTKYMTHIDRVVLLTHIGLPSVLEPIGLRDRRPDGLTLNPWYKGRSPVLDATVVDTFAESHYIVSAATPGSVATDAERPTNVGFIMASFTLTIYFQLVTTKPLVCMASPLPHS